MYEQEERDTSIEFKLGESDLEYVQSKGTLAVGITDFAPMDYPASVVRSGGRFHRGVPAKGYEISLHDVSYADGSTTECQRKESRCHGD